MKRMLIITVTVLLVLGVNCGASASLPPPQPLPPPRPFPPHLVVIAAPTDRAPCTGRSASTDPWPSAANASPSTQRPAQPGPPAAPRWRDHPPFASQKF